MFFQVIFVICFFSFIVEFGIFPNNASANSCVPEPKCVCPVSRNRIFSGVDTEKFSAEERRMFGSAGCVDIVDTMDKRPHPSNWDTSKMVPANRFKVQSAKKIEGRGALAIFAEKNDPINNICDCDHKFELWVAGKKRCNFGQDVWHSFSFHINGHYPDKQSVRWVVGQWKQENGGSPFLAQRFDNGVFHISIESGKDRCIIASADGGYKRYAPFLSESFKKNYGIENGIIPENLDLAKAVKEYGMRAVNGEAYRKAIIQQDISKFPFVAEPNKYRGCGNVVVEPAKPARFLSNPDKKWVSMRYRVKGDRIEKKGIIEVWENGEFIVRVKGKIGNDQVGGDTQYFKVGHYRDVCKHEVGFEDATLFFDNYKRSTIEGNVD